HDRLDDGDRDGRAQRRHRPRRARGDGARLRDRGAHRRGAHPRPRRAWVPRLDLHDLWRRGRGRHAHQADADTDDAGDRAGRYLHVAGNTSVAREYHAGLSAMLGIQAALAARKGYVAEEHVLEMPRGFFAVYGGDHLADVTKDLGTSWDISTNMAIKLVPGGHP